MLYRPAYCCNCGEKIVREEWRLWTSRRFCALCATEHQGIDFLPKVIIGLGALAIVFGIANGFRSARNAGGDPVTLVQKPRPNLKPATVYSSNAASPNDPSADSSTPTRNETQQSEQPQREKRTSDETVYYCGAITKKGTPCTRRVKTKGYCWQHAKSGQIAPARF